jgi:AcrR family transcriptional regulator
VDTRDAIVTAACASLASTGLGRLTVAGVASAARVSTALVHYHFATKQKLLAVAAAALGRQRTDRRVAALRTRQGVSSLDALWGVLAHAGAAGERTAADLVLLAREDPQVKSALRQERRREEAELAAVLPGLFGSLGTRPRITPEELAAAVSIFLDGATMSLLAGAPVEEVRASYDAFWLALVALGQAAPPAR